MFQYVSGDLFESNADALVNTVNCKGVMGKGIAYQFKLRYPQNFKSYRKACLDGTLRPGRLHYYLEAGKIIINFPTKDDWRHSSRIEYVKDGLAELVPLIQKLRIKSIAIPPLGCGLGGLAWSQVRPMIEEQLADVAAGVDVLIYDPSSASTKQPVQEPKLNASALVLMELMETLERQGLCTPLRVRLTAYFANVYYAGSSKKDFFKFSRPKTQDGPQSLEVERLGKSVSGYMAFHGSQDISEIRDILYKKLVSKTVNAKLEQLRPAIRQAADFTCGVSSDRELSCLASACFAVQRADAPLRADQVEEVQQGWPKAARAFSAEALDSALEKLYDAGILDFNMFGYRIP